MDGAVNVFLWLPHNIAYVPPMETIEAANVSTNNFDAEQGIAGGMAVTVSTRSGTNELHGAAFAFYDNQNLRARNFFLGTASKPRSITNVDGAAAGGPIVRNNLFFFGSWEGDRERTGRNLLFSVASAPLRQGDFRNTGTAIYDPNTGDNAGVNRTPFPGNFVPLDRQSAITRMMQDLVPLPNRPGEFANDSITGTQGLDRDSFDAKINWNRGPHDSMWGKWSMMNAEITAPFGLGAAGGPCVCDSGGARCGSHPRQPGCDRRFPHCFSAVVNQCRPGLCANGTDEYSSGLRPELRIRCAGNPGNERTRSAAKRPAGFQYRLSHRSRDEPIGRVHRPRQSHRRHPGISKRPNLDARRQHHVDSWRP